MTLAITSTALRKAGLMLLILTGGLAFFWLAVIRILAKLTGGAPCPYALAWVDLHCLPPQRAECGLVRAHCAARPLTGS